VGRSGLDSSGSGQGLVESSCEHNNERLGSINSGEFINKLSGHLLLKDSVPWS
jgi:hypothetical protein